MIVTVILPGEELPQEYFDVRYEVLRKPLGSPRGSELLNDDNTAIHAYISVNNKIISVGRIALIATDGSVKDPVGSNCPAFEPLANPDQQKNLRPAVQVRQMGTLTEFQGKGFAAKILNALEQTAIQHWNARTGWLQARLAAIQFYEKCGWTAYGEEYDVNNVGLHLSMLKKL